MNPHLSKADLPATVKKPGTDYFRVNYPEPHAERTPRLLQAHPELKKLIYPTPSTLLWIVGIVALQLGIAMAAPQWPWWLILIVSYTVGG
jgi:sphingolipid delta-4 desaturase